MTAPRASKTATYLALATSLCACNLITGTGDLVVKGGSSASGGGAAGPGGAGGAGPSGSSVASGGGSGPSSSSGAASCSPACGANQYCDAATLTCACNPGFYEQGGACKAAAPGDPTTHTEQEVCDRWTQAHGPTTPDPVVASGAMCDAGTLEQSAIVETLERLNAFRWMAGLGPSSDDATLNAGAQKCANLEAWWDFNSPQSPHSPPQNATCYTSEGASFAGQSNIAWGSGSAAQAIDQFVEDNGNETTMGHRRWILNPPLDPVGIGYWETGGQYGNAECLRVFGTSGSGPNPPWVAMPPPGFVPIEVAQWTWTFHGSIGGIAGASISMIRLTDGAPLAVQVQKLQQGFGQDAISWTASGWSPEAGKSYQVTVSGLDGGDVVYVVKPVSCN